MSPKNKSSLSKTKKGSDWEVLQQNWESIIDLELRELENLEGLQKKKIEELAQSGISSGDIFKLKKLDELSKVKNPKSSLEQEVVLIYEQLTGIKTLKKDVEKLFKKFEDIKFVVMKLKEFSKDHFDHEKKFLDVLSYIKELKVADIDIARKELIELDSLWEEWNLLKKEKIFKKIKNKQQVLSYIQNKSEAEIEKLKSYSKKLKVSSRGKKSDEIYRELRIIPTFSKLRSSEIRDILFKLESELKNNTPEELEKSLLQLQEIEQTTLSEIEERLTKINLVPYMISKAR